MGDVQGGARSPPLRLCEPWAGGPGAGAEGMAMRVTGLEPGPGGTPLQPD